MNTKISQRLRNLRKAQGISMKKVAALIGVPVSTYRDWEYGSKVPAAFAPKLAAALGASTLDLLGIEGTQPELYETIMLFEEGLKRLRKIYSQEVGSHL